MVFGTGLLSADWLIGLWGLAMIVAVMCLRTRREEEMTIKAFGENYRKYAQSTGLFSRGSARFEGSHKLGFKIPSGVSP